MELLVAVAILTLMVVAFGEVISQAQRVVSLSQVKLRCLQTARAVRQTFQRDIAETSKNGFLQIGDGSTGSNDSLVLLTAGPTQGRTAETGEVSGNGTAVVYGMCNYADPPEGDPTPRLLIRRGLILNADESGADIWSVDFGSLQALTLSDMATLADNMTDSLPDSLVMPPKNVSDVEALWQVLGTKIANLEIAAGRRDGTSIDWDVSSWRPDYADIDNDKKHLWTRHNQQDWPELIRIRFQIVDERFPEELREQQYEIICPVP